MDLSLKKVKRKRRSRAHLSGEVARIEETERSLKMKKREVLGIVVPLVGRKLRADKVIETTEEAMEKTKRPMERIKEVMEMTEKRLVVLDCSHQEKLDKSGIAQTRRRRIKPHLGLCQATGNPLLQLGGE